MSEFFALARSMEADAAARYSEIARRLRQQGAGALADIFDRLAKTEMGHVRQVEEWADRRGENVPSEAPWPIPDTFDAPPGEVAGSKLMTPYRALASAVRHGERAFAFWSYVAAHADTAEVKDAAESMALEELEHVSLLRRERRKAFHAERAEIGWPETKITLGSIATTERQLADLIELRPQCTAGGDVLASTLAAASREAARKLEALQAEALQAKGNPQVAAASPPAPRSDDVAAISEYLAEVYLRLAETSPQAAVVDLAQELAKGAIIRLGALNRSQ